MLGIKSNFVANQEFSFLIKVRGRPRREFFDLAPEVCVKMG